MYKEGDGIEHVVLIEDGHIVPWDIVLGTDSHTDTNGALGSLAFGVGTTDALYAMATGHLYDFMVPESVKFEFTGILPKGVYSQRYHPAHYRHHGRRWLFQARRRIYRSWRAQPGNGRAYYHL